MTTEAAESAHHSPLKRQQSEAREDSGREKRAASDGKPGEGSRDLVLRILCPGKRTGSIIGKGGSIIKSIRDDTNAKIKIAEAVSGVDERIVIVSGPEDPNSDWTPAQEALIRVINQISDVSATANDMKVDVDDSDIGVEESKSPGPVTARILIQSTQIGCILGKGGSIITNMRNESGSNIRVMPKDQIPGCALPSDELVQVKFTFTPFYPVFNPS